MWVCYPVISEAIRRPYSSVIGHSSIRIVCKDFSFLMLNFNSEEESRDVYESLMQLTAVSDVQKLYAYMYKPGALERKHNGWKLYDAVAEYERMGAFADGKWRITNINKDYAFSPSYPKVLVVPSQVSDTVINYGAKYRSKARIPVLSYYHKFNGCTITRCSQPMVGLKKCRSAQDEKLIAEIFASTKAPDGVYGASSQDNIIVDARPTANAMAQVALGGGSEPMDNYKPARKAFLGIDNVHVMRDSINKVVDALRHGDISPLPPSAEALLKSHWLDYLYTILTGTVMIVNRVHSGFSHVVVHCSDGWDRTPQLTALAQVCLDPYFRTIDGFIVLIEKEWVSFGHRFQERSGLLTEVRDKRKFFSELTDKNNAQQLISGMSSLLPESGKIKYTGPIMHQFLDCVYQILKQFPDKFEYNERFLRRLLYHVYSCQYGTFLFNSEREAAEAGVSTRTRSVWDYFLGRRAQFINPDFTAYDDVIVPDPKAVQWWSESFGRTDEDMNSTVTGPTLGMDRTPSTPQPASVPATPPHLALNQQTTREDRSAPSSPLTGSTSSLSRLNRPETPDTFPSARLGDKQSSQSPATFAAAARPLADTVVSYGYDQGPSSGSKLAREFESMTLEAVGSTDSPSDSVFSRLSFNSSSP